MNTRKRLIILFGAVLLITLFLFIFSFYKPDNYTPRTFEVHRKKLMQCIGASGEITVSEAYEINKSLPYEIESYYVQNGDIVHKGDKLFSYSSDEIDEQLAEYRRLLENTVNQLNLNSIDAETSSADALKLNIEKIRTEYNNTVSDIETEENIVSDYERNRTDAEKNKTYYQKETERLSILLSEIISSETEAPIITDNVSETETEKSDLQLSDNMSDQSEKTASEMEEAQMKYDDFFQLVQIYDEKIEQHKEKLNNLELAKIKLENTLKNMEDVSLVENALEWKKTQADVAVSTLAEHYEAMISSLEKKKSELEIVSDYSGVVVFSDDDKVLFRILDDSSLKVKVNIDGDQAYNVKKGNKLIVTTDADFEEIVCYISQVTQNSDYSYEVQADLTREYNKKFKPGMNVYGKIVINESDDVMAIPYDALIYEGDNCFVYICRDGDYRKTPVEIVLNSGYYVGVESSEISEGDDVLIDVEKFVEET